MKKFLLSLAVLLVAGVTLWAENKADIEAAGSNSSYTSTTTADGWVIKNAAFVSIDGVNAPTLNGKTTAVGSITSPTLTGGISTLSFNYANTFSETKGVSLQIDILQNGAVVKSQTLTETSVTQKQVYSFTSEEFNVTGDFVIEITNLSPSHYTSNKDRVSIWNLTWENYSSSTPGLKPAGLIFEGEQEYTVQMGESFTAPTLTNDNNLEVTYSSSNENVATVNDEGTVTIVGAGETVITAESAETDEFAAGKAEYTLTVILKPAGIAFPGEGVVDYSAELGETFTAPELSNPNNLAVTWSSSNDAVATVDGEGNVTIVGYGTATITAATEATDEYEAGQAKYNILVNNPNSVTFDSTKMGFTNGQSVVGTYDLINTKGVKIATVEFAKGSGQTAPAYYDSSNDIRMYIHNTATITMEAGWEIDYMELNTEGSYTAKGNYFDASESDKDDHGTLTGNIWTPCGQHPVTSLVITNEDSTQLRIISLMIFFKPSSVLANAELSFVDADDIVASEVSVVKGEENTFPKLDNPHNLTVTYTSSNTAVATVDAEGKVTLLGFGTTIISASSEETGDYAAGTAEYTLTVTLPSPDLAYDGTGIENINVEFVDGKAENFTAPTLHNP
ncbi:MAG: Ig-like domain-containing protein, partial [Muribaculaceae bacterium]|nr:Ig-like domain-containing protein [Muribaculaceae bacterium]